MPSRHAVAIMGYPTSSRTASPSQRTSRHQHPTRSSGVTLNLLASALTILTAIALLGAAAVLGDASAAVVDSKQDDHVVYDFYRAVNEVLQTGEPAALDHVVAQDLVFHSPAPQLTPNRSGLERYLLAVHDSFPAFQVRVEDVVIDGDRAIVRTTAGSDKPGSFLGLPLSAALAPWGQFDRLRMLNGKIVEMWTGATTPELVALSTSTALDSNDPPQVISFAGLSASTGEHREWTSFYGARVLYVAKGFLKIDVSSEASVSRIDSHDEGRPLISQAIQSGEVMASAGDMVSLPSGARYSIEHRSADPEVVAYTVSLPQFLYSGPLQPPSSQASGAGIEANETLFAVHAELSPGEAIAQTAGVKVAHGRARLQTGAQLSLGESQGYVLLEIEQGALVLTHAHDVMTLDYRDTSRVLLIEPGAAITLHNLGDAPASVFMVTVLPGDAQGEPA